MGYKGEYTFIETNITADTIFPTPLSQQKNLNLNISSLYKLKNKLYTRIEIVQMYFNCYDTIDKSILMHNYNLCQNDEISKLLINKLEFLLEEKL